MIPLTPDTLRGHAEHHTAIGTALELPPIDPRTEMHGNHIARTVLEMDRICAMLRCDPPQVYDDWLAKAGTHGLNDHHKALHDWMVEAINERLAGP